MLALAPRRLLRDSDGSGLAATPPSLPVQAGAAPAAPAWPGTAANTQLCAPRVRTQPPSAAARAWTCHVQLTQQRRSLLGIRKHRRGDVTDENVVVQLPHLWQRTA
jgi:hypothetical protein